MADAQAIQALDDKKIPYVLFKRIKRHVANGTYEVTEKPEPFAIRMDSTHNSANAIINYLSDGCVIAGHKNLDPKNHQSILAFINGVTREVDPRLLEDTPKSALKEKVGK